MIDRFGNVIFVGWAAHEILWLKAALELPYRDRMPAFEDIAGMTGRPVSAIRAKAYALHSRAMATWAAEAVPLVAGCVSDHSGYKPTWKLNAPTRAMLMAGRASCRNRTEEL